MEQFADNVAVSFHGVFVVVQCYR